MNEVRIGKVTRVITDRGFGFATNAPDADAFIHVNDFVNPTEFETLEKGDEIEFVSETTLKGFRARQVRRR